MSALTFSWAGPALPSLSAMTTHTPLSAQSSGRDPAGPTTAYPTFRGWQHTPRILWRPTRVKHCLNYPAEDAYVVSVGGTSLTTSFAAGRAETGWAESGGGISPHNIPIPTWQKTTGVITASNDGSTIDRGPHVSANSDFS